MARVRAAEARAAAEAEKVMQAWDMAVTKMARLDSPATVASAVAAAIQLPARVWNFEAPDAVEAVMLKVESRSPLTFSPLMLGKPRRGMALRAIAGSLMKHQDGGEITVAIWNAIKKARTAQKGSSS